MKRDLLIASLLIVVAASGIGVVVVAFALQKDDTPKTIPPRTETIAELPKKPAIPKTTPVKLALVTEKKQPERKVQIEKKVEPEPMKIEEKKKVEPEPKKSEIKVEPKVEPKVEVKIEPKKEDKKRPVAKAIAFGDDLLKLNDPDGEYTVKPMHRGAEIKLIGRIKTLKIAGIHERAVLDTAELVADEIIFLGGLNSGAKAILGKTTTLRIRDINDGSLLDASACAAREIFLTGAVNSRSTVKLNAPGGSVEIFGEINDHAQIDIVAPDGQVLFKSRGDAVINGDAQISIVAREVEFRGAVNGTQTQMRVTLTKAGTLKFRRLNGAVRLHWRKADAGDPEPRIDAGEIGGRAQVRMLPAGKK